MDNGWPAKKTWVMANLVVKYSEVAQSEEGTKDINYYKWIAAAPGNKDSKHDIRQTTGVPSSGNVDIYISQMRRDFPPTTSIAVVGGRGWIQVGFISI